jgi:heavy metal translocating P-type ATPase
MQSGLPVGELPVMPTDTLVPVAAAPAAPPPSPTIPAARSSSDLGRVLRGAGMIPVIAVAGIAVGGALWFVDPAWGRWLWLAVLVGTGAIVVGHTVRDALRGHWASDIVAALAIVTAVIMREPLAGLIVVIMQTGGEALERYAEGRASDAVRALEADAPRNAHLVRGDAITDVPADDVEVGDVVLVRPGELVPCDGIVVEGVAALDVSRLTGEPVPMTVAPGVAVRSGSVNGDRPFTVRATAVARESQYARIVELVRTAQETKAPFQRIADRYAIWFTPLTLVAAGLAAWLSGDMERVLAVLVVATPCPLILAPPIAIIGGINRAARRQVIVRNGGAMERLARVNVAVFDKTGTITIGRPEVSDVILVGALDRPTVLALAASLEQASGHLLARTVVEAAQQAGLALLPVTDAVESPGRGIAGHVGGHTVAIGSRSYAASQMRHDHAGAFDISGAGLQAYVVVDGAPAGIVVYADHVRPDVMHTFADLDALGLHRRIMLSGDHEENARATALTVGITEVRGDLHPEDKVAVVRDLTASGARVMMVGDGTNDAPAMSAATVGIAMAGHGGGVTAEAADVVLLVDRIDRVNDAVRISRRTMRIARESVLAGLGLSGVAMIVAAFGHIAPTAGALPQEVIDVAVILNALRASAAPAESTAAPPLARDARTRTSEAARPGRAAA